MCIWFGLRFLSKNVITLNNYKLLIDKSFFLEKIISQYNKNKILR